MSPWSLAANFLITGHLLFAVVIIQNPIAQFVEGYLKVKEWAMIAKKPCRKSKDFTNINYK